MHARLIAILGIAALVASCQSVLDRGEFLEAGKTGADASLSTTGQSLTTGEPATEVVSTEPAAETEPASGTSEPAAPAPDAPTAATPDVATASADGAAEAAPPVEGDPVPAVAAETRAEAKPRGFLAMFGASSSGAEASLATDAATAPSAEPASAAPADGAENAGETANDQSGTTTDPAAETITESDGADAEEFSEAELAGEIEADPDKIAVPEQPFDDGQKHDFVNVYTSTPDNPEPSLEGLPGVTWEDSLIMASRGEGDDPSSFFEGTAHPFARTVPGVPRQTAQAANGLLLAHSGINVNCIKPGLLSLVRRAEGHFGKKVVVTSGYRSPSHNRRVRGARHSQHMYCAALDLYMPGVARDDLARWFFAQPDRGGVGLYCHTRSIHIDVGRKRQWRWGCKRRAG